MSTEPRVLHKRKDSVPPGAVYIGRPTKWGNPFVIGPSTTREQAVRRYREWVIQQPHLMAALPVVRDAIETLGCLDEWQIPRAGRVRL